ncbi:tRNA modification GTPase GTPBP3-like protein, partial [Leptotrombidium deliense]
KSCFQNAQRNCTIFALSSGLNPKGNAIAINPYFWQRDCRSDRCINETKRLQKPRTALLTSFHDPKTGELIDKAIAIYFPSESSYTGEDLCELHVHGSHSVVASILEILGKMDNCRPSNAGEFTKRAFINGKMDLTEAEGISHLIASQTAAQRRHALKAVTGGLTQYYENWRKRLMEVIAYLEANIDFGEDQLLDEEQLESVINKANLLRNEITTLLSDVSKKSERINSGVEIAIIGEPNVGKSSLINKLCQREISIVSPITGTTRDVVEGLLDIGGYAVRICDTAGIKDITEPTQDVIEKEGIKRAISRAQNVDLIIYVIDRSTDDISKCVQHTSQKYGHILQNANNLIYVVNKLDLIESDRVAALKRANTKTNQCYISCKTSEGFNDFVDVLTQNIKALCESVVDCETTFVTERHKSHLYKVAKNLEESTGYYNQDLAISAYYLREACKELSYITGRICTEDILDVIFRDFCVGK